MSALVDLALRMLTLEALTVPLTPLSSVAGVLLETVMVLLPVPASEGLAEDRYEALTKPMRPLSDCTFFQPE